MITFSPDPRVAEHQMQAVIFYLAAFGYVDGDFDASERRFVEDYIARLIAHRAQSSGGDAALQGDVVARWTQHFREVLDNIARQIEADLTESVGDGEDSRLFVVNRLKLRCFELFQGFDDETRVQLLDAAEALIHADGVVYPTEAAFAREVRALLDAPLPLDDAEVVALEAGAVVVSDPKALAPRQPDHPFLQRSEWDYDRDPATFAQQAERDLGLVRAAMERLDAMRAEGAGRLAGHQEFTEFRGTAPFLDGHVHVLMPEPGWDYELLVLGDLHGCYSCLKAALLQADFFGKVQAHHDDPKRNPTMKLVFLGDYIDRGRFSYTGVLRGALQLFLAAPEHVYVLRGNHEYYVEHKGRVLAPVRPAEAMASIESLASHEVLATYMKFFEALPNLLVFDRTMFVHAGIPREAALEARYADLASLNDPELRFQMLWSDPSSADVVPRDLQDANARFPFGRRQFRAFMARLGLTTMVRGHERVVEGFRRIYDEPDAALLSVFSAGGAKNDDLPEKSSYREVTPMALTIRHRDGVSEVTPFPIDYERYNDPRYNAFFRDRL